MGFFGRERDYTPPHPRREVEFDLPLNPQSMITAFDNCVDFAQRPLFLGGDPKKPATLFTVVGMVKSERVNDYVLRPMSQDETLARVSMGEAYDLMLSGALYNLTATRVSTVDSAVAAMIEGSCLLLFPGMAEGLLCSVATEEKRSVTAPQNEPAAKGAMDSFVESLRTNTSLVRRRLRAPTLKIVEQAVGRQTKTPVDILYIEGIADLKIVRQAEKRLAEIDIDALLTAGELEQYLVDGSKTAFPLLPYTQRPDRFCTGLCEGRVGVLADGLPIGYLLPGTLGAFFKTEQDKSDGWMVAAVTGILRYLCVLVTLFLPAIYVAAVTFSPEMIPTRLMLSIIAAKQNVPFSTLFEVLIMLAAFEVLQEAGLRLPASIGQTMSILGGLVVGTAAVEAKIVSPAVLIAVALAGIAGYTVPNRDFAGALRLWRFLLAVAAGVGGLTAVVLTAAALLFHLAGIETFGVSYLTPFAANAGGQVEGHAVVQTPLPSVKYRDPTLNTENRRKQR
ncbi:MAG: spore germination protein [Oscillospiraceae bacterium]